MSDLHIDGVVLSPAVMASVVAMAAEKVDGVSAIGAPSEPKGLSSIFKYEEPEPAVEASQDADGNLTLGIHVEMKHGCILPDVAQTLRERVAEAFESQIGIRPTSIDIFVDALSFE